MLAHGLLVISSSVLTPIYHAPDEPVHVDAAVRLYNGEGWPVPGKAFLSDDGISAWAGSPCSLPSQPLVERPFYLPQADAVPRDQRPHWDQLSERYPLKGRHNNQIQQMVAAPAAVLRDPGGGPEDPSRIERLPLGRVGRGSCASSAR